ncbi:MAG: transcriptional regulator [Colwellia sp.]|nr:transcriptional regulator [Colwellia sp.]
MSENKFETISSLVDNHRVAEQSSEQIIDEILKDEHLSTAWQQYHLIGDVIRDDISPTLLSLDLSAQIAEAIADEPSILAPKPLSHADNKISTLNSGLTARLKNTLKSKVTQLIKPVGQLAIAASAAGLMIVSVQQNTADTHEIITPSQVVQTKPLAGFANPVSFNFQQNIQLQPDQKALIDQRRIVQQRRFQVLLSDHQQQIKLSAAKSTQSKDAEQSLLEKKE